VKEQEKEKEKPKNNMIFFRGGLLKLPNIVNLATRSGGLQQY